MSEATKADLSVPNLARVARIVRSAREGLRVGMMWCADPGIPDSMLDKLPEMVAMAIPSLGFMISAKGREVLPRWDADLAVLEALLLERIDRE